jgi:hypothetical protein
MIELWNFLQSLLVPIVKSFVFEGQGERERANYRVAIEVLTKKILNHYGMVVL